MGSDDQDGQNRAGGSPGGHGIPGLGGRHPTQPAGLGQLAEKVHAKLASEYQVQAKGGRGNPGQRDQPSAPGWG